MTVHTTPTPVRSLEARYYTDPAIWAQEQQGLLALTWQFAGHVSRIPNAGDYFTFRMAGEDLFAIRGRDGEIRAFYNVCQHRAHQLLTGTGSCKVIVCPYHAWTYEHTGALRAGPNIKAVEGFDRGDIKLTEIKIEDFCGFLFANLDPDAKPMEDWFPGVREELRAYVPNIDKLAPLEWVEVPEDCNWKVSVENYSECYHCSLNHKTFSTGVIKPETYDIQPQGYCLRHTTECQGLDEMTYPIDMSVPHAADYSSWFLWPMFSFQVYPGREPDAVDHVTMFRGWFIEGGAESDVIRGLAVQDRETPVEEDIGLVESVQRGLQSRGYRPGPLVVDPCGGVESEHSIRALQQWMREAVDG